MCKPSIPEPPPPPPPKPDFKDEQVALAAQVQQDRTNQKLAGLASTIKTGSAGVLSATNTSKGAK